MRGDDLNSYSKRRAKDSTIANATATERPFRRPRDVISLKKARSYLLLAIEAADDALVGYTKHSFDIGVRWDHLFQAVLVPRPFD
jgi:hypothetical protein